MTPACCHCQGMTELSLFTGCGGGVYAGLLMGWRSIGYVEIDAHCQRVIKQRIADGIFHDAPVFGDIRAFIDQGYAASYTGMVDVLAAGPPCQPFSVAGKQQGADDERNLWPETLAAIRIVRPRHVLLENVPGLIATGYLWTVLGDLAACGYDARWDCIPASALGANHQRDRLWIVAHAMQRRFMRGKRLHARPRGQDQTTRSAHRVLSSVVRSEWWQDQRGIPFLDDGAALWRHRIRASGNCQIPAVARAAWCLLGH